VKEDPCEHMRLIQAVRPSGTGCKECLETGAKWVQLRMCLTCGHVGCCDASPGRHATKHFSALRHAIMRSIEPGETWGWCFVDELEIALS
jgi:hypothetical protein